MVLLGDVFMVLLRALPADTESANHPEGLTVFVCYKVYTESVNTRVEGLMVFVIYIVYTESVNTRVEGLTVFVSYRVYTESVNTRVSYVLKTYWSSYATKFTQNQ